MGRIADLCGEIAAAADEGPEGLVLPPDVWDRLRGDWSDADIEDGLAFVRDSLLQTELVDASSSSSGRGASRRPGRPRSRATPRSRST
jgi:hypothetical protein